MTQAGDIVLARLPQADEGEKLRPALVLATLPGRHGDLLVCGISTQVHQIQPGWDDEIVGSDADFADSGLHAASIIRLSFLAVLATDSSVGGIGRVMPERLSRMRERLATHLRAVE